MAIKKRKKNKSNNVKAEKKSSTPPHEKGEENSASSDKTEKKAEQKPKDKAHKENRSGQSMKSKDAKAQSGGLAGTIKEYLEFLKLTRIEYKKINWPDRRQVIQETWTVLILVTFITLLVLGYDWVLGNLVFGPLEHWIKLQS